MHCFYFPAKTARILQVKISAVIITFNEEKNIQAAVESVSWADEVLVIDSNSTDRTVEVAEAGGAKVIQRDWPGFSEQKQFGVETAANDWIFSLDADERVSDELKLEIEDLRKGTPQYDAYRVPRLSVYMGREIRHSGWYPDRQLRFFNRRKGCWNGRLIHESVEMNSGAKIGELKGDLLHFSFENAVHHHRMIGERYAPLAARHLFDEGKRATKFKVMTAGPVAFLGSYIFKLGFLDGFAGFCIALFAAHHAYLKHLLLWEMQNRDIE